MVVCNLEARPGFRQDLTRCVRHLFILSSLLGYFLGALHLPGRQLEQITYFVRAAPDMRSGARRYPSWPYEQGGSPPPPPE